MLTLAKEAVEDNGLSSQYQFIHSAVQEIEQHKVGKVDILLFHAVME